MVNNLCGSKKEVRAGGKSTTRDLQEIKVKEGDYDYSLIDTPGVNST